MSIHIQIVESWIRRVFLIDTIKIFVLIISDKISGKFSGKLTTGIFNQLSSGVARIFFGGGDAPTT